ncbi:uncharacterized protein EI97DRAFT_73904 [Westerdykella ornata]|uniref:Uncharacterized protein n=1 Tax=Westerdykella ornata TaxID=318751 RepID=A0A6A6JKJ9_WESOR|nr:uncharacterized protein EI97DRAFT_73904 [Westerdykella ornata]KAF2275409.1 hypothetical protein EI97DRAFT_73904 [Westerdykella ornata]
MESTSKSKAVVLTVILPGYALAVPKVTVVPLTGGCSALPGYNSTTGIAGPWIARADSTGNSALDGLPLSIAPFTNDGTDRFGFVRHSTDLPKCPLPDANTQVTLPKQPPRLGGGQTVSFRCASSRLQASLPAAQFYPDDPSLEPKYVDLVISTEENWQASFGFNLSPSVPVEAYAHYDESGKRVEGVFLGAAGKTEVALKYNWGGNAGEYYLVRLNGGVEGLVGGEIEKGEGKEKRQDGFPVLDDRDWTGFLKIVG